MLFENSTSEHAVNFFAAEQKLIMYSFVCPTIRWLRKEQQRDDNASARDLYLLAIWSCMLVFNCRFNWQRTLFRTSIIQLTTSTSVLDFFLIRFQGFCMLNSNSTLVWLTRIPFNADRSSPIRLLFLWALFCCCCKIDKQHDVVEIVGPFIIYNNCWTWLFFALIDREKLFGN